MPRFVILQSDKIKKTTIINKLNMMGRERNHFFPKCFGICSQVVDIFCKLQRLNRSLGFPGVKDQHY